MKKIDTRFQVNSRLASLLSQEYASTEKAIKELVDNAWDADADHVSVSLPAPMSEGSIVILDDGTGMTTEELTNHYLSIASDRRERSGERTSGKQRLVKGRKGVGKFAGLMAASAMTLETYARGVRTSFTLRIQDLATVQDIEHLPIVLNSDPCDALSHGTRITLSGLHQHLAFPDPLKFRQILLQEYGRETDFAILINDKPLGVDDVDGLFKDERLSVRDVGDVRLRFAISEKKSISRQPGIVIRVDGKAVGKPSFFGLDEQEDFPQKLLKRLYGEIDADGLREHVTAGWDSLIENSELLMRVAEMVRPVVLAAFKEKHGKEIQLAHARLRRDIKDRLAALPENRREFAEKAIKKILDRFYQEPEEKIAPFIYVLLEAIERSEYGTVVQHLAEAKRKDIAALADALDEFGLVDMAHLVEQANARNKFLDQLESLSKNERTLEAQMHKAIEKNLWIFGPEFSLFSSNKTLQRQVEDFLGKKFSGKRANNRPDLLLNENLNGECLLIEFKRPSHPLNRDDYTQATDYRHDLAKLVTKPITVLVMGGKRSPDFPISNLEPDVKVATFLDVIATARRQLRWQLTQQI
ncbi:ATP-binding protein [Noviherbaspirillum sedimenti]|uniref:ATP-binding protein n=1 Tax=Noviherbaspirillum sedimenti TaxID=2320865 RepID=A0A3A3FY55_9BURK|nr:ATP-binding protein [Noviherbaspirillum sedimenti]RJG00551.1 ATP-binding protein [Noviherbaspirillum sedimenti]